MNVLSPAWRTVLAKAAAEAAKNSLTGLEFAAGIPGSLGGAIVMNAGAYGGEMKHIVKSLRLMDMEGNIVDFTNEQMEFDYRKSILFFKIIHFMYLTII